MATLPKALLTQFVPIPRQRHARAAWRAIPLLWTHCWRNWQFNGEK